MLIADADTSILDSITAGGQLAVSTASIGLFIRVCIVALVACFHADSQDSISAASCSTIHAIIGVASIAVITLFITGEDPISATRSTRSEAATPVAEQAVFAIRVRSTGGGEVADGGNRIDAA